MLITLALGGGLVYKAKLMETKNILISVVVLLVVIGGGYWLFREQTGTTQQSNPISEPIKNSATVEYSGQGFSPNSITVKSGTTVTWVNKGSDSMWVASDPHPVHTNLSEFDALKGVPPRGSYSYTFTKIEKWGYHNHLDPNKTGEVVVE